VAKLNVICKCKNLVEASVGQNVRRGKVNWFLSYKCPICGNVIEEDGVDETPAEIRNVIISQEGEYGLIVPENTQNVTALIATIRKTLNLDLKDASNLKKLIPGVILKGTKEEMYRMQVLVKNESVEVSVEKV
jgi:hypothetical protein